MHLTQVAGSQYIAQETFTWPQHPFPQNYTLDVDINFPDNNTCAGVFARDDNRQLTISDPVTKTNSIGTSRGEYGLYICPDGGEIIRYDPQTGSPTVLNEEYDYSYGHTVRLHVAINGSNLSLSGNGGVVYSVQDNTICTVRGNAFKCPSNLRRV